MLRTHKNKILISFIFIFVTFSCGGKSFDTGYSQLGFYTSPEKVIHFLDPSKKLTAAEHFILANAYKDKNDLKKAIVHYANSAFLNERKPHLKALPSPVFSFLTSWNRKSDFYEDSSLEIAQLFFKYAEYDYSYKFADLVTTNDLSLYREAVILKARTLEVQKRYDEAVEVVQKSLSLFQNKNLTPVLHIRIASALQKKGDYAQAMQSYMNSLSITTEGWQGSTAAKEAYSLIKNSKAQIPEKALLLASALLNAQEFESSFKIISSVKQDSYEKDRLLTALFYSSGKTKDAEKIISKYSTISSERASILSLSSHVLWEKGNKRESIQLIKELLLVPQYNSKNEHKRLCYYLYERNSPESAAFLSLYSDRYPSDQNADKMLWLAAKPYIEKKDFSTASGFLQKLIRNFPEGSYSGNARFWLYLIYNSDKKKEQAEEIFQEMVAYSASSPYTMILMNRKKNDYVISDLDKLFSKAISSKNEQPALFAHSMLYFKNADKKDRKKRINKLTSNGFNKYTYFDNYIKNDLFSSSFKKQLLDTEKFFATGHNEGILRVLNTISASSEEIQEKEAIEKDKALLLSSMGNKYNNFYYQYKGTENLLDAFKIQENIFMMSDLSLQRILPYSFPDDLEAASKAFIVPRQTILSVMKAESEFNHRAVSGAGAAGLMQLMPPTAKDISKKIKKPVYDMKNPNDSIFFGTYYLSWLNKFFKGNFRDVVAGYNAGPGNIQKWKNTYDRGDVDIYTEQIPYDETRAYVLYTEKYLIQYSLLLR